MLTQEDFDMPEFVEWPISLAALRAMQPEISQKLPSE